MVFGVQEGIAGRLRHMSASVLRTSPPVPNTPVSARVSRMEIVSLHWRQGPPEHSAGSSRVYVEAEREGLQVIGVLAVEGGKTRLYGRPVELDKVRTRIGQQSSTHVPGAPFTTLM